ncbi:MAG: hypothetical protein RLZZ469_1697 [Bacteroidota bacterium]
MHRVKIMLLSVCNATKVWLLSSYKSNKLLEMLINRNHLFSGITNKFSSTTVVVGLVVFQLKYGLLVEKQLFTTPQKLTLC